MAGILWRRLLPLTAAAVLAPFELLLFVLVDGWALITRLLVSSYK